MATCYVTRSHVIYLPNLRGQVSLGIKVDHKIVNSEVIDFYIII